MAEQTSAQTRLDKLVAVIAANMVAEVCSIYLRRAGKCARTVRHRRPEPRGRAQHADEGGRGPCRPRRGNRRAGEPQRRAAPSAFLLSSGDRRRPVQVLSRRADRARRAGVRRAHGAEPRRACSTPKKKSRRCRPSPWCWPRSWRMAGCSISPSSTSRNCAPTGRVTFKGEGLSDGVAVGRVVLHEPRVKVERMIADDPQVEAQAPRRRARRAARRPSTRCSIPANSI